MEQYKDSKGCNICGSSGLITICSLKGCSQLIHPWCSKSYHLVDPDANPNALICSFHQSDVTKKDLSRLPFIKEECRRIISSPIWQGDFHSKESPTALCNGHLFWYIVCMDYFPQGQDLSYFPDFPLVQRFPLDWNFSEPKMKKTRSADNNYVDSLLKYYNNELEETQKQIHPFKQEVFKNAYDRWEQENKTDDEELMKRYALIEKENEKMNNMNLSGEKDNDEDGVNSKCRLNVHIKCLERQKKKTLDDLYILCRTYEKWEKENKPSHKAIKRKRTQTQKVNHWKTFTPIEDLSLEFRIRQHIHKVNITQEKPFILIFNLKGNTRKSKFSFTRPQFYNLLAPEVILEDRVTIENRSPDECLKRYQDLLFTKIKNDALLKGEKICIYQGKGLGLEEAKIRLKRAKYERKHALGKRKKQKEFEMAQVSKETYCTCNKPYYYLLPRNPKWTDEEYETKIKENEMIECTQCQNWFHLGCVGYQGTVDEAQKDDAWMCKDCSLKKTKL